jgi:hypothetical protein
MVSRFAPLACGVVMQSADCGLQQAIRLYRAGRFLGQAPSRLPGMLCYNLTTAILLAYSWIRPSLDVFVAFIAIDIIREATFNE